MIRRAFPSSLMAGVVFILFASGVRAAGLPATEASSLTLAPGASLEIDGDSSLHRYSAKAHGIEVNVSIVDQRAGAATSPVDVEAIVRGHAISAFTLTVPVDKLSSGEKGLDANMRKALKGDRYKQIRFQMESYEVLPSAAGAFNVVMHGRLSLAGVEREIEVRASCARTGNGVRLDGSKDLLMTDYGIKPPTMMLGAIKTADLITIKFNATLQKGTGQ